MLAEADDGEPFAVPGHALDQVFDRTGAGRPCRSATSGKAMANASGAMTSGLSRSERKTRGRTLTR